MTDRPGEASRLWGQYRKDASQEEFLESGKLKYNRPHYRLEKSARIINRLARGRSCTLLDVGCGPAALMPLLVYRRRKGEAKGFSWTDYRDLIIAAHRQLAAPLVWVWDNLNIHLAPELAEFAEQNKAWLRIYRLPAYAPDMNPAEGIWSLLKRSMANFAAADLDGLVRIVKRKLKKIQYRPHLIDGCLAATGLTIEPW